MFLAVSAWAGCGSKKQQSNDDHVLPATIDSQIFDRPTDCRSHIKEVVCVVESRSVSLSGGRPCSGDNSLYVREFEKTYDQLPAFFQKMFCSMRHIYIEPDWETLAYAGAVFKFPSSVPTHSPPPLELDGAIIGIHRSVFREGSSLQEILTWKEQSNFTEAPKFEVSADLPQIQVKSKHSGVNLSLFYILIHEFGHLFEHANLQKFETPLWSPEETLPAKSELKEFCFYVCLLREPPGRPYEAVYSKFAEMPFVNTYASTNGAEDFAETLTFYVARETNFFEMNYHLPNGTTIPLTQRIEQGLLESKRIFIKEFLESDSIQYP